MSREAGGRIATYVYLRDMNVEGVSANGLPFFRSAQIAVDTTLVCPVNSRSRAQTGCANRDGAWLAEARRRKERTYPELMERCRCRLVVLALEVGGRWSDEALDFVRTLARARIKSAPELLR
jgi:hypothetical protein